MYESVHSVWMEEHFFLNIFIFTLCTFHLNSIHEIFVKI